MPGVAKILSNVDRRRIACTPPSPARPRTHTGTVRPPGHIHVCTLGYGSPPFDFRRRANIRHWRAWQLATCSLATAAAAAARGLAGCRTRARHMLDLPQRPCPRMHSAAHRALARSRSSGWGAFAVRRTRPSMLRSVGVCWTAWRRAPLREPPQGEQQQVKERRVSHRRVDARNSPRKHAMHVWPVDAIDPSRPRSMIISPWRGRVPPSVPLFALRNGRVALDVVIALRQLITGIYANRECSHQPVTAVRQLFDSRRPASLALPRTC
ncbi:hypothetical protein BC628DRAFT_360882 [Trametes gibbosa]|nr:hypothetical protein BC628DRAFT_360882 [Trametes gibbosa]